MNIIKNWSGHGDVRILQYAAAICVGILQVAQFVNLTWGSPILPRLLAEDSPIGTTLTYDEASWVASAIYLGALGGSILLALLLDQLGPKRILLMSAALTVISWIIIGLAKSFMALLIGRVIAGVGDGASIQCINIYVCEIASKDIRGRLATIPILFGVFGNLYIFGAGPYLDYTVLIISCAVFPVLFLILFVFMPNSPYYFLRKNKRKDAERNLKRLLNTKYPNNVEEELRELEKAIASNTDNVTLMQLVLQPNFRKCLLIVFVAYTITNFCGLSFIGSYLQIILSASNISLSKELTSVCWGFVQVPGVILSGLLVDKLGRKTTLCISSLGASISLFAEGTYIYLQDVIDLDSVSFLPVLCIILYGFFVSMGLLHLPYLFLSELFVTKTKNVANFVMLSYSSLTAFATVKVFGSMFDSWGLDVVCWCFGSVCFLGVLFSLFLLPETKRKTLDEIQNTISS